MSRDKLLPANLQDTPFWRYLADAIDNVWLNNIDNPQKVFRLLRDTFAMTFQGYLDEKQNSYPNWEVDENDTKVFDLRDFFNFSPPPLILEVDTEVPAPVPPATPFSAPFDTFSTITAKGKLHTGFPQLSILVYYQLNGEWLQIPSSQILVLDAYTLKIKYLLPANTKILIAARGIQQELAKQLRYLGFQYSDMEFLGRSSNYANFPSLHILASTFSKYAIETQGTKHFMDFFGYCLAAEFSVKQLWVKLNDVQANTNTVFSEVPYLFYEAQEFTTTLAADTNVISLGSQTYDIEVVPYVTSNIEVYVKQPNHASKYIPAFYYNVGSGTYNTITLQSNFFNPVTGDNNLIAGTEVTVKFKRPPIPYSTFEQEENITTPFYEGGEWLPTSHVDLYYSLDKYGGSVNFNELENFFLYIKNLNLVLRAIVLFKPIKLEGVSWGLALHTKVTKG